MSNIAIPGVNGKYNSNQTVEKLVKVEATKLDVLKVSLEDLQAQKDAWLGVNRMMGSLRTIARSLYSFENPFNERKATSSDENSLTAIASREAIEGSTKIDVIQLATADRFISADLPKDQKVDAGTYEFRVGKDIITMKYNGGSLKDFAENLSRRATGVLKASVIETVPERYALVIEGLKPGAENPLSLHQSAQEMGVKLGLVEKAKGSSFTLAGTEKPKTLKNGENVIIPIPTEINRKSNWVLEVQVFLAKDPKGAWVAPQKPSGPVLPPGPEVTLRGATLRDLPSDYDMPPWVEPVPPPKIEDGKVLFLATGSERYALPEVRESSEYITLTIPLDTNFQDADTLVFENRNTERTLSFKNARIYDPTVRAEYVPSNAVSRAQDAKIKIDGLLIQRPTNTIKDAVLGVTLNLEGVSPRPVNLKVEPDRDLVKTKLIELVNGYNIVQREINILTARKGSSEVVKELDFLTEEEKKEAMERLGMYQGETTLTMIKSRLQGISQNAYPTREGTQIAVLAHIGISTNAAGQGGGGIQASSLRGYLEINETTLDKALRDNFIAVKELFGTDTNNDLLVDNGIGFRLEDYIRPFTQTGGVITGRTNTLDTQIKSKQKEITKFEEHLVAYERELKEKYGKMEGTLNQLESSSKEIEGLNRSNNN